ncbi:MAG: regulatory protein RecX [Tyzzerella sp.]|nr:regulatory protein RecX [Tyzzerella sp.]
MDDMIKQAKLKALSLLTYMDRTELQLRKKLKDNNFSDEVIEQAIAYVKSFGYINDAGYAERYVMNKQSAKSRQELYVALSQKGISKENIEHALETCYESENELSTIYCLLEKKHYIAEEATEADKRRMYNYLLRKGFHREDVSKALNV